MHAQHERRRGISPVIGIILMVAVTVILAGTVAVFFMGFGDEAEEMKTPSATFSFDYEMAGGGHELGVKHASGDPLEPARTHLVVNDARCTDPSGSAANPDGRYSFVSLGTSGELTAGDRVTLDKNNLCGSGDTLFLDEAVVSVVWQQESRSTEFLAWRGPDA